ncbi:MAG: hypothetical protein Q7S53_01450 [bacterium]|nr:hypothetical protein [bacterium]
MTQEPEVQTHRLCHIDQNCCPEVAVGRETVSITDDDGGRVELPVSAWNILKDRISSGEIT